MRKAEKSERVTIRHVSVSYSCSESDNQGMTQVVISVPEVMTCTNMCCASSEIYQPEDTNLLN